MITRVLARPGGLDSLVKMKTTATRAPVSTVEFVSPKDLHMSATVLSTGLELTVKHLPH